MEKKYIFVKRVGPFVYYNGKLEEYKSPEDQRILENSSGMEGYATNKEFLLAEVEGYATPYPPSPGPPITAPTGGESAPSAPPPPPLPPLTPGVNPYKFEIAINSEETDEIITLSFYLNQLIETRTYPATFVYTFEGEEFIGETGALKELEVLSTTSGFFIEGQAFPAFVPPSKEDAADALKEKAEELAKLGEVLLDAIVNLIPTEDEIIEMLAQKEPMVAKSIKMIRQEQKENEEAGMTKEEAKAKAEKDIEDLIKKYKKAIKDFVKAELKKLKDNLTVFVKAVKAIPEDVEGAAKEIFLPPSITAPPGAFNPVYAKSVAKRTLNALGITLSSALVAFGIVMGAALLLKIELPEPVVTTYTVLLGLTTIIEGLATVINAIPG